MEIWKDVVGYEGLYQVSDKGRVKSLDRIVNRGRNGSGKFLQKGRILSFDINGSGYKYVSLSKDGKQKQGKIHRLECIAFLSNPENKRCVNHKDGIKLNNELSNLEWSTHSENNKHAYKTGLKTGASTGLFGGDHPHSKIVIQMDLRGNFIEEYRSAVEASELTNTSAMGISATCNNRQKSAGGFKWKLKEKDQR